MSYSDFTSLSAAEEQEFVVFERTTNENQKKATTMGLIAGGLFGLFVIGIALVVDVPKSAHAGGGDDHSLGAESAPAAKKAAPKQAATPVAAPEPAAAAEAAPVEAAAEEAKAAVEAPTPPPGATKAPPTALIGQ